MKSSWRCILYACTRWEQLSRSKNNGRLRRCKAAYSTGTCWQTSNHSASDIRAAGNRDSPRPANTHHRGKMICHFSLQRDLLLTKQLAFVLKQNAFVLKVTAEVGSFWRRIRQKISYNNATRRALGRAHLPPTTVFWRIKTTRRCFDGHPIPVSGIFPT